MSLTTEAPAVNRNFIERLNRIRLNNQWTWSRAAAEVDMSTTMLHYIRTGRNGVTDRVLARLSKLEAKHGINPLAPDDIDGAIDLTVGQSNFLGLLCHGLEREHNRAVRLACHNRRLPKKITAEILNECVAPDGLSVIHAFRPERQGGALNIVIEHPDGTLHGLTLHEPPQLAASE